MLRVSVGFLFIGLLAMVSGLNQWMGLSFELGRILFFVLLGLSLVSFFAVLLPTNR